MILNKEINNEIKMSTNGSIKYSGGPGGFIDSPSDVDFVDVVPFGDGVNATPSSAENTTCQNEYCVSEDEYVDMIYKYIFPDTFEWILISLYIVVFIVGLIGNFLVVFVVWRNKSMQTVTNYFIVNLSVADFLVILICLPPAVLEDVTETWYIDSAMCKVVKYFQGVSVSVSVLTLSVISIERYYAICYPLAFKTTTTRVRVMIIVIWAVAFIIYAPELYALGLDHRIKPEVTHLLTTCKVVGWEYNVQAAYTLFQTVALYCLPFCLMGFAYVHIAICLWSNPIPSENNSYSSRPLNSDSKSNNCQQLIARRKVAKMLVAVVVMFGVCYLPVHLTNILRYAQVEIGDLVAIYFALISHWLCYFNSAINPLIYNFMSAKFQKEFAHSCTCCADILGIRHRRQPGVHGDSTYAYRYTNTMTETENFTLKTIGPNEQYD